MRNHFKVSYLVLSIVLSCSSFTSTSASVSNDADVTLEVHNVGQGNFVTLKVVQPNQDKPEYMIIDAGTSAFKKEFKYTAQQVPLSPLISPSKETEQTPQSTIKDSDFKSVLEDIEWDEKKFKKENNLEDQFLSDMRTQFGATDEENVIHIKTVLVTHPDTDHYNWLFKLFNQTKDKIDYLIFGGLPEHYDPSSNLGFKKWLDKRHKTGSRIYFPAIQYRPISSLEEVMPSDKRTFAKHLYTKPSKRLVMTKDAFDFGIGIKISMLSVNPTHIIGESGNVLRLSEPEDDNRDSLVLKIAHGSSSVILTGDATGVTTTRILDNYRSNEDYLLTNILLASHHGSASHASNNLQWLQVTQPEYVFISNGHSQGHPHAAAYELLKKSSRLKRVPRHKVLVGKKDSQSSESLHYTQRAIYSTLTSRTLTASLLKDGTVKVRTQVEGNIEILKPGPFKKEQSQSVAVIEEPDRLLVSPSPMKKKIRRESVEPIRLSFNEPTPVKRKAMREASTTPLSKKQKKSNMVKPL